MKNRVYAIGMTREQADLPEFPTDLKTLIDDHEEQVRGYIAIRHCGSYDRALPHLCLAPHLRDTYAYEQDASLYDLNAENNQNLKLYQERLVANKQRVKTGK